MNKPNIKITKHLSAEFICRTGYKNLERVASTADELMGNDDKHFLRIGFDYDNGIASTKHRLLYELKLIDKNFVLITDIDDSCVPYDTKFNFLNNQEFNLIYNHPYLCAWYSINFILPVDRNEKLHHLPVGLDYHTIEKNSYWGMPKTTASDQEKQHLKIYENSKPVEKRLLKCIASFLNNNNRRLKKCGIIPFDRSDILSCARKSPYVDIVTSAVPRTNLWQEYSKYCFVIAPSGHGLATHRIWEALILGSIPITERSPLDELYREFPVVILGSLDEITAENLTLWLNKYGPMTRDSEIRNKYLTQYWTESMFNHVQVRSAIRL